MIRSIKYGKEGPKEDPYGFREYIIDLEDKEFKLHCGLSNYIMANGNIVLTEQYFTPILLRAIFEKMFNVNIDDIEKEYVNSFSRCKCGCTEIDEVTGHPGETLFICTKCKSIINSTLDMKSLE